MRVIYLLLFLGVCSFDAYSQASFKLLEDNLSPILNEAVQAHKDKDGVKAESLYSQYISEQQLLIKDSTYLATINWDDWWTDWLQLCYNFMVFYIQIGKPEKDRSKMEELLVKGLDMSEMHKGVNHLLFAHLLTLGPDFIDDPEKKESLYLWALRIFEEQLGKQHITYADEVSRLANFYLEREEYMKAESLLLEIKPVFSRSYKKSDWDYISYLFDIFSVYFELRNYKKASEIIDEINDSLSEVDYYDVSSLVVQMTELKQMIPYMEKLSVYDASSVTSLNNYISHYNDKLKKVSVGKDNSYIDHIIGLAFSAFTNNNIERSDSLYKEALALEESINGENTSLYKEIQDALRVNRSVVSRIKKLETLREKNISVYGKNSSKALEVTYPLLELSIEMDNWEKTTTLIMDLQEALIKEAERNLSFLTENQRAVWWKNSLYMRFYSMALVLSAFEKKSIFSEYVYNYELFSKSILLNSSRNIKESILSSNDTSLIRQWLELTELKRDDHVTDDKKIEELEKSIVQKSQLYSEQKSYLAIQCNHIKEILEPNEVAIEFMEISYAKEDTGEYEEFYFALILRPDFDYPIFLELSHVDDIVEAMQSDDKDALYDLLWLPIEHYLEDNDVIYIAPAGLLHSISFGGLQYGNGKYYLCEDYTIHNVLSTRDIVGLKQRKEDAGKSKHIALFGGPDYSLSTDELGRLDMDLEKDCGINLTRSLLDDMDPLRGQGFSYLPGSRKEVLQIEEYLSGLNWNASLYIDKEATKTRFKSFSSARSPDVIHLSTHGFYFPQPKEIYNRTSLSSANQHSDIYRFSENPLMRSGVAFSGANYIWRGGVVKKGMDDGILTAYDISNMNLFNTELVVLSACNTGRGDIDHSEGVYGLQRAFRLAGVQSMIVSLWEVPDKETVELMTAFYSFWGEGMTKKEAFDKAQMKMRYIYPDHPEKWAGFVMIE